MSNKAGALLWNRKRVVLPVGVTDVDTGLTQVNQGFDNSSIGEPPLGVSSAPPGPPAGTLPASRIQVIPLSPIGWWLAITHSEPYVNPATGTVWVTFTSDNDGEKEINVLFWDPHTSIGPGQADTYNAPIQIQ